MKVAVVGCGAVGSYYGARLLQSGHDVHFLLRSDYDAVRAAGVHVQSYLGDFHVRPRCARTPDAIGPVDLVVIALKTTANDQFPHLLPPLVGPGTLVLTLQNGLGNEDDLARVVPVQQILGGMCFVCLNRDAPGHIRHLAHGHIVIGEYLRPPSARTHTLAADFQRAQVSCAITENLEQGHWEKLTWNIPFNGLGVAGAAGYDALSRGHWDPQAGRGPCCATDVLLKDPRWEALLRELMHEVIRGAAGQGFRIDPQIVEVQLDRTRTMGPYKASTLLDYERGQPLELDGMFLKPLHLAKAAGVDTPWLKKLCTVLQQLDAARG